MANKHRGFGRVVIADDINYEVTPLIAATTVTGASATYSVGSYKTITLEIAGSATTPLTYFYASGSTATPHALMGTEMASSVTSVSATVTDQLWQFNVAGLTNFTVTTTPRGGATKTTVIGIKPVR